MKRDQESAKRMRHLRQAWGFKTSSAFAKFLGISEERWNNVENGYPVSVAVAKLLYEKADVSIDYTWRGECGGLSGMQMKRLGFIQGDKFTGKISYGP